MVDWRNLQTFYFHPKSNTWFDYVKTLVFNLQTSTNDIRITLSWTLHSLLKSHVWMEWGGWLPNHNMLVLVLLFKYYLSCNSFQGLSKESSLNKAIRNKVTVFLVCRGLPCRCLHCCAGTVAFHAWTVWLGSHWLLWERYSESWHIWEFWIEMKGGKP